MKVITRRIGDKILISEGIVLEILQLNDGRVKLGIIAPPSTVVLRAESPLSRRLADARHPFDGGEGGA